MKIHPRVRDHAVAGKTLVWALAIFCALSSGPANSQSPGPQIAPLVRDSNALMSEEHRVSVSKIVVLPGVSPVSGSVTGSYGKNTMGAIDGFDQGRGFGRVTKDIYGIPMGVSIPILSLPGAIFGGLTGGAKRQIQDLRDALTAELAKSADSQLSHDALATDVFWRLREMPKLDPKVFAVTTPIPSDTDAILYVSFSDSTINVQEDEAVLTMSVSAALLRLSDGVHIYENQIHYQDRDTLANWTRNDNAAWYDFANYSRHYLGREISAALFERVNVQHKLQPEKTKTVLPAKKKTIWDGVSKSLTPTLAWQHTIDTSDPAAPWAKTIAATDIDYEIEVYDSHRLVYAARRIPDSTFTIDRELEPCMTYYWSVRPSYKIDGDTRFGEWMRSNPDSANGNDGSAASVAAAYIYDFPKFKTACGRR